MHDNPSQQSQEDVGELPKEAASDIGRNRMSRRLLPTFGSGIDKKDGSCSPTSLDWLSFPGGASQTHSVIIGGDIQSIPEQMKLAVKRGMDTAVSQLFGNDFCVFQSMCIMLLGS